MGSASVSVDEFQALEAKVLRAVEVIRHEREARSAAESELAELKAGKAAVEAELAETRQQLTEAQGARAEADTLQRERETVRLRVEKMLAQMDELL